MNSLPMLCIVLAQPPAHLTVRSHTINDITGPDMVSVTKIMLSKALRRERPPRIGNTYRLLGDRPTRCSAFL